MKKSLIALAVLAASGASFAQSSVELFGIADTAYTYGKSDTNSKSAMTTSSSASSQLGFRGTEDIGGGLKAGFWLEAGLNNDSGAGSATNSNNQASGSGITQGTAAGTGGTTYGNPSLNGGSQGLTFNRRSTASIGGNFGEVRVGREYTAAFWTLTGFDPFATNGVGANVAMSALGAANTNAGFVRVSNSVTYLYNHGFNATSVSGGQGFHAMLQYAMGENLSNSATPKDGNSTGGRVGYNAGPLSVAVASTKTTLIAGDITSSNIGASYDLGVAKLMAQYSTDKVAAATELKDKAYLIGATVPMGQGSIRAAYSEIKRDDVTAGNAKASKFSLGYVYDLSKRTALYATFADVSNKNGATVALNGTTGVANKGSTGYDIGLTHKF